MAVTEKMSYRFNCLTNSASLRSTASTPVQRISRYAKACPLNRLECHIIRCPRKYYAEPARSCARVAKPPQDVHHQSNRDKELDGKLQSANAEQDRRCRIPVPALVNLDD